METAESVINDALFEIQVNGAEQSVESVDFQTAMRYLNRMMAQFDADGISLGYTQVTNAADAITVPLGAINGVIFNLAVRLANSYDFPVGAELAANAKMGLDTMRRLAQVIPDAVFPNTLPIGSGNEWDSGYYDKYYPGQDVAAETETGRFIALESDTDV